ncbi:trigger factor [Gemmatimonadota bacterium]
MTIDGSKLRITVEEQENWRRTMSVTVPAELVEAERGKIVQDLGKKMKLPGFRKGRVPTQVVEQRYGSALQHEMLDKLIGDAYREALNLESMRPISEGEVDDIQFKPEEDLTFTISFDVEPEITVSRTGGFTVERKEVKVGAEEIDKVLQRLREQNGVWNPMEEGKPEDGELVSVEIQRIEDAEPQGEASPYELALPDVEAAIRTLEVTGSEEFDVTFPDDFPDEEKRGEVQRLNISLKSRRAQELPEADDDFARSLGDFEDLSGLTSRIREDLEREADTQADQDVREQLIELLLDANPFEVPASLPQRYLDSMLSDSGEMPEEQLKETMDVLRPGAERAVRRTLVIEKIAEMEGLKASEEELDERVEEIAKANDTSPAEIYANLQKSGRLDSLEHQITEQKVFDYLKEQSEIK